MKRTNRIVARQHAVHHRRGSVSPLILILLGGSLIVVAFILDALRLHQAGFKMLAASDAAALAAAGTLIDDRTLLMNDAGMNTLCNKAQSEANLYALTNGGVGPASAATDISSSVEVLFGSTDQTQTGQLPDFVRVVVHRTSQQGNAVPLLLTPWIATGGIDMQRQSIALIDRSIVGFAPSMETAIPMVPLGLRSDPSQKSRDAWESLIAGTHRDEYAYDATTRTFLDQQGDGLPEFRFQLSRGFWPLRFGNTSNLQLQIESGLRLDDVDELGGKIQLSTSGPMLNLLAPPVDGGSVDWSSQWPGLEQGLKTLALSAEPRILPLVCPSTVNPNQMRLVGFIAARVVRVELQIAKAMLSNKNLNSNDSIASLTVVLQPSVIATTTALTVLPEQLPESTSEMISKNPFIAKVRLVQ